MGTQRGNSVIISISGQTVKQQWLRNFLPSSTFTSCLFNGCQLSLSSQNNVNMIDSTLHRGCHAAPYMAKFWVLAVYFHLRETSRCTMYVPPLECTKYSMSCQSLTFLSQVGREKSYHVELCIITILLYVYCAIFSLTLLLVHFSPCSYRQR